MAYYISNLEKDMRNLKAKIGFQKKSKNHGFYYRYIDFEQRSRFIKILVRKAKFGKANKDFFKNKIIENIIFDFIFPDHFVKTMNPKQIDTRRRILLTDLDMILEQTFL